MEVHVDKLKFEVIRPVVTIGTFDGVHLGHQSVVNALKEKAKQIAGESLVITFEPHPRHVLNQTDSKTLLLTTLSEKIQRFRELKIDHLLILTFTPELGAKTYEQFFREIILETVGVHILLVGHDHKFGKNRAGDFAALSLLGKEHNVAVLQEEVLQRNKQEISSTKIRNLLLAGQVREAAHLLDYTYRLKGKVIDGDKLGREIGFPTANISLNNPHKLLPKTGVYAVEVLYEEVSYKGMLNIGMQPTVSVRNERKIEVHLFDFDQDIYGEILQIFFIRRIRDEYKFSGIAELVAQLQKDKQKAEEYLSERA